MKHKQSNSGKEQPNLVVPEIVDGINENTNENKNQLFLIKSLFEEYKLVVVSLTPEPNIYTVVSSTENIVEGSLIKINSHDLLDLYHAEKLLNFKLGKFITFMDDVINNQK